MYTLTHSHTAASIYCVVCSNWITLPLNHTSIEHYNHCTIWQLYQSSFVVSLYKTSPLSSKGRVIIFYGNKSSSPLLGFSTTTNTADHEGMLEINLQQMPTTVDA